LIKYITVEFKKIKENFFLFIYSLQKLQMSSVLSNSNSRVLSYGYKSVESVQRYYGSFCLRLNLKYTVIWSLLDLINAETMSEGFNEHYTFSSFYSITSTIKNKPCRGP